MLRNPATTITKHTVMHIKYNQAKKSAITLSLRVISITCIIVVLYSIDGIQLTVILHHEALNLPVYAVNLIGQ